MRSSMFLSIIIIFGSYFSTGQSLITGTVSDKATGQGLPGVAVFVSELQKGVVSDKEGHYRLEALPRGHFQVEFRLMGYASLSRHVDIKGEKELKLDIKLEPQAIITPEVTITAVGFGQQHNNAIKVDLLKANELRQSSEPGAMQKLSAIPGVDIISRGAGIGTPVIRGLSLVNILALNNGTRIENFQFSSNHPFLIDDFGVDRIEVIKGAASVLYGANAVGGVINFIREKPAPVGQLNADINTGWDGASQGFYSNIGLKGSHDGFYWGMRGGMQSYGDYRQPDKSYVPNSRFSRQNAQLMAGFNRKRANVNVYYDYMHYSPSLVVPPARYGVSIEGPGRRPDDWYQDLNYHLLAVKSAYFLNNHKIEGVGSYQRNHRVLIAQEDKEVDMLLQAFDYTIKDTWNKHDKLMIITGLQGNTGINVNGRAPEHVLPDYRIFQQSAFAFGQYKPGPMLSVQAGLRYDYTHIDIPAQMEGNEEVEPLQKRYQNLNYSLGLTQKLSNKTLLRINFAKAFRNPSIAELTQDGGHGARAEFGNIALKNQENYEADLGLHYHARRFVFDVATFYNRINHYIYLHDADSTWNGLPVYVYQQTNARLYGVESGLRYRVSVWELSANYSFVKGLQDDGSVLPWIPQSKISAQALWRSMICVNKKLFADYYISGNYAFGKQAVAKEENPAPPYWVINTGLRIKLPTSKYKTTISLSINNVFNTEYIDFLSQIKDQGYYNEKRSLNAALRIWF